jgi:HlyD family secretion protein
LAAAHAVVSERESGATAAQAVVTQRESELDAARRRLARSETLSKEGASSIQELDDDRARVGTAQAVLGAAKAQVATAQSAIRAAQAQTQMAEAAVSAAKAQVVTAEATINAARSQVVGAQLGVEAGKAAVSRVEVDIKDGTLTSPRDGRVQYRITQPGEVLGNGGKVLNLVDLGDVYMTFFLPETAAGRVALGSEVHVVLDAAPQYVIPAKVSFVASTAQFTPKTVETASERQKLMFRVKAQIDRELLLQHMKMVKTGLPGVAWIKLDPKAKWPKELEIKVVE